VNRSLSWDIIKSHGMNGKGSKIEGGGWRGTAGKKGTPKKLGVAD